MSLTSAPFIFLLLPFLLFVYYLPFVRKSKASNIILLLANVMFYCMAEPVWGIVIFASVFLNWLCVALSKDNNKISVLGWLAIITDVIVLVFFKAANTFFAAKGLLLFTRSITLPVGISYYTFLAISFVVDSSKSEKRTGLFDAALYMTFFAAISSGPITRFESFSSQLAPREFNKDKFFEGLGRFAVGYVKKVVFADTVGVLVSELLGASAMGTAEAWICAIAYSVRIYLDFSGVTDMAVGTGNMFGFTLAENFNYPYVSRSISEFWKRWHISLTKWFTAYVYIPLGGSRVCPSRHIFNLFAVWCLTSLWHGFGFTFLAWGMIHFIIQLLEKKTALGKAPKAVGRIYTLLAVIISWCFFGSDSIGEAVKWIGAMFGAASSGFISDTFLSSYGGYLIPLAIGIVLCFPTVPLLRKKVLDKSKALSVVFSVIVFAVFVLSLCYGLTSGYSAPLYAGF